MILVDTDIPIDLMRGENRAGELLEKAASGEILAVSIVTKMELIVGCRNKAELASLADLLDSFEIMTINELASQRAAALLEEFRLSHGLLIPDAFIAATALTFGCRLLTKNRTHFFSIPGLELVPLAGTA